MRDSFGSEAFPFPRAVAGIFLGLCGFIPSRQDFAIDAKKNCVHWRSRSLVDADPLTVDHGGCGSGATAIPTLPFKVSATSFFAFVHPSNLG